MNLGISNYTEKAVLAATQSARQGNRPFSWDGSKPNYSRISANIPDALQNRGSRFGLYNWLLTALNGLSIIAYAGVVYSSTIIGQSSKCDLNTTPGQQGLLRAAPIVAAVLGSVLWGYLADTRGRRSMLLVSFASATLFNTIASLSVNWVMLLVFQFIAAFLASGQYSISMTLLSECVPLAKRNLVVLIVASIFMLTQGFMALLAIPIMPLTFSHYVPALNINWNPWRTTLLMYGLPSVVCFIWMLYMQESPKYTFLKNGEAEALYILKRIHRINNFSLCSVVPFQVKGLLPEDSVTLKDSEKPKARMTELFKGKLSVGAFLIWLPDIADQFMQTMKAGDDRGFTLCHVIMRGNSTNNDTNCSLNKTSLLIVFGVGCVQSLLYTMMAFVVSKLGRRNMVMVVATICGASGIIVNLVPNAVASLVFFIVFLMGMLLLGLYTAIGVALFPTHLRALAVSMTLAAGRIMLAVVVVILKLMFTSHCALAFYIFATIVLASALVVSFLPDERYLNNPKSEEEKESWYSNVFTDGLVSATRRLKRLFGECMGRRNTQTMIPLQEATE